MKSILIANGDQQEAERIQQAVSHSFNAITVTSAEQIDDQLANHHFILLDQNLTERKGLDVLKHVTSKRSLPVLMIAEDSKDAAEAFEAGAENYMVKTGTYVGLLDCSIKKMIDRFDERQAMKRTLIALRKQVAELEQRLGSGDQDEARNASNEQSPPEDQRQAMLNQIAAKLRQGDINLPTYPDINVTFKQMLEQGANINEITDLLKKDVAISSKLISLSNSAHYKGVTQSKTLEQVVSRLGLKVTRNWVEVITNRSLYTTDNKKYFSYMEVLWQHSLSCAYAAQAIARLIQLAAPEVVFAMGLFHDIGKLILLQIIVELETEGVYEREIDAEEVMATANAYHTQFGASILKKWNLPDEYSQVASWHHDLKKADPVSRELLVIHLSNWIVKSMGYEDGEPEEVNLATLESTKSLRISAEQIDQVKSEVRETMEKGSQDFS